MKKIKDGDLFYDTVCDIKYFVDKVDGQTFYARYNNYQNRSEFSRIDSDAFRSYLFKKSFAFTDPEFPPPPESFVTNLKYMLTAENSCEKINVHVRVAGNLSTGIEYDLQNEFQETVKITSAGWIISPKAENFIVPDVSQPQVHPKRTNHSPLDILRNYVNIDGDMYLLFVVWLIQAFSKSSHHALLILAEKGSGKSTTTKLIRQIVDPNRTGVSLINNSKDDILVLLANSSLCCFDNVSSIPDDISDILCTAVTGGNYNKRALYTNSNLTTLSLHNTLVINGINAVPGKDDLAERMLLLKLKPYKTNERRSDNDIWGKFKVDLPYLLGSIFSVLSEAIVEFQQLKLDNLPRMADSYAEMVAIAKALGISEEDFYKIYTANVNALQHVRDEDPVVEAVKELLNSTTKRKISGTAEKVFSTVYENYSGNKALLPKSASHFNRRLDELHSTLLKQGVRINIDDTGSVGTELSLLKLKKKK